MALDNDDLIVVQKSGGGELRKSTVSGLLALNTSANDGQINIDGGDGITASGDNATANQAGDTTRTLSIDETWLSAWLPANYPHTVPGDGNININGGDGITATGDNATADQSGDTTRTLAIDETWLNTWLSANNPSPWTEDSGKLYPTTLTNNVGIGVDNPSVKLDVAGTSRYQVDTNNAFLKQTFLDSTGGAFAQAVTSASDYLIQTSNATRVAINPSGNVGIGTDSPAVKLSVLGSGDATDTSVNLAEYTANIRTDSAFLNIGSVSGKPCLQSSGSGTAYSLLLNPFQGNVGIGTDSPSSKLQIGKDVDATNYITLGKRVASAQSNLPLIGHTSSDGAASSLGLCATSSGGHILFYTGNDEAGFGAGSNEERVRIKNDGNVGIGTDSPEEKLHVAGKIRANDYDLEALPSLP